MILVPKFGRRKGSLSWTRNDNSEKSICFIFKVNLPRRRRPSYSPPDWANIHSDRRRTLGYYPNVLKAAFQNRLKAVVACPEIVMRIFYITLKMMTKIIIINGEVGLQIHLYQRLC